MRERVLQMRDPPRDPTEEEWVKVNQLQREYRDLHFRIKPKLKAITKLNLKNVSPRLLDAKNLQLVIPGGKIWLYGLNL